MTLSPDTAERPNAWHTAAALGDALLRADLTGDERDELVELHRAYVRAESAAVAAAAEALRASRLRVNSGRDLRAIADDVARHAPDTALLVLAELGSLEANHRLDLLVDQAHPALSTVETAVSPDGVLTATFDCDQTKTAALAHDPEGLERLRGAVHDLVDLLQPGAARLSCVEWTARTNTVHSAVLELLAGARGRVTADGYATVAGSEAGMFEVFTQRVTPALSS